MWNMHVLAPKKNLGFAAINIKLVIIIFNKKWMYPWNNWYIH